MNRASTLLSIIKSRLTAQDWMRYTDTSQITTVYLSVSWCTQHFFRSKPYAAMRWLSIEGYDLEHLFFFVSRFFIKQGS
jgi:hypothetical protein